MRKRYKTSYAVAGTLPDIKEYHAELALQLKRRGVALDTFLEANNEMSFPTGQAMLYKHIKALDEGRAPLSAEKGGGGQMKLEEELWDVVVGAILLQEEKTDLQC